MADVLNLETESTPLNTQLENPELESVTELQEPSLESTHNHDLHSSHAETPEFIEAAAISTDLDFNDPETLAPEASPAEALIPAESTEGAPIEASHAEVAPTEHAPAETAPAPQLSRKPPSRLLRQLRQRQLYLPLRPQ